MNISPLAMREDLADVEAYTSPQPAARVRLNTNESPYPPPVAVVEDIGSALKTATLHRYPEREAAEIVRALSARLEWAPEGLSVANGSNEIFLQLFLAFGGPSRSSLTFEPTYSLHTLIARIAGTNTIQVARDDDFLVDLDRAIDALLRDRPDIIVLCSPNNPSGGCEPLGTVRALLDEAPGLVVVDEAYGEFAAPEESVRPLLDEHPNLVLVKTFSKAWRLAGMRIGYLLAHPSVVAGIQRVRLPYHLSTVTQAAALAALRHDADVAEAAAAVAEERDRIALELEAMGLRTYPSRANFVLFEVDDADGVWRGLVERGILIRNYSSYPNLANCLRVTAGLPDETNEFLSALKGVLGE